MGERRMFSVITRWVSGLVWVIQQSYWGKTVSGGSNEKKRAGVSPGWGSRTEKSIERRSIRGDVPVFKRWVLMPSSRRFIDRLSAENSPERPAEKAVCPTKILPCKN